MGLLHTVEVTSYTTIANSTQGDRVGQRWQTAHPGAEVSELHCSLVYIKTWQETKIYRESRFWMIRDSRRSSIRIWKWMTIKNGVRFCVFCFFPLRVSRCGCTPGWKDDAELRTGRGIQSVWEWGRGGHFSEDLSVTALLGEAFLRWSSMKQFSETTLACVHTSIQGEPVCIHFIRGQPRVM